MSEDPSESKKFDWEAARNKLLAARRSLTGDLSPQQVEEVLDRRAHLLSQTVQGNLFRESDLQLLSFLSCDEKFAVPAEFVRSAMSLEGYAPIPCTPDFVIGAFNVRGQVYPVVDIRRFLRLPVDEDHIYRTAMLVETGRLVVGMAVDTVYDVVSVLPGGLAPPASARLSIDERCVKGITHDLTLVLDLSYIMGDPRFVVNQGADFRQSAS